MDFFQTNVLPVNPDSDNVVLLFTGAVRLVDALQTVTPPPKIVPAIADSDIPSKFPKGHTRIKPYLRMTPQPNL